MKQVIEMLSEIKQMTTFAKFIAKVAKIVEAYNPQKFQLLAIGGNFEHYKSEQKFKTTIETRINDQNINITLLSIKDKKEIIIDYIDNKGKGKDTFKRNVSLTDLDVLLKSFLK